MDAWSCYATAVTRDRTPSPSSDVTWGRPGQALAYKMGERVWLAGRSSFPGDRHALELGSLGLDQLTAALQQVDHVRSGRHHR
ncbi:hypothetical protein [Salinispora oceanensis]|uniref:hypothetical protein n=1 Tax=Salinispora oceanensis TaxID=1050199 RepID=UPI0003A2E8A7|nr:hypothetical protein [Salinispora oceanensis]